MERNPAISLCRVFSMFLIILCHIIDIYTFIPGSQFLGQIFNVGVYTFLVISGYLYSKKNINNFCIWIVQRAKKVMIPSTLVSVCVFVGIAITELKFDIISFFAYFFNLQGLIFLIPNKWIFFREQLPLGPLWFITVIMLCYCMLPMLQRLKEHLPNFHICVMIFAFLTGVSYIVLLFFSISLFYFLTFTIGYCIGHFGEAITIKPIPFLGYTVITMLLQVLRLYVRSICDGTGYYHSYVGVSHMALGIWILLFFFWMQKCLPKLMTRLAQSRWNITLDNISLYVYMTHSVFIVTGLSPYRYIDNLLIATLLFFVFSYISALCLRWTVTQITSIYKKRVYDGGV